MRRIRVLQEATAELEEAAAWYELQRNGLGAELARAVDAALDVLESPTAPLVAIPGRAGTRGLKRLILRRFPFDVIVREQDDEVVVVAFAHQSRRSGIGGTVDESPEAAYDLLLTERLLGVFVPTSNPPTTCKYASYAPFFRHARRRFADQLQIAERCVMAHRIGEESLSINAPCVREDTRAEREHERRGECRRFEGRLRELPRGVSVAEMLVHRADRLTTGSPAREPQHDEAGCHQRVRRGLGDRDGSEVVEVSASRYSAVR